MVRAASVQLLQTAYGNSWLVQLSRGVTVPAHCAESCGGTPMLYVPVKSYLQPSSDAVELGKGRSGQKLEPPISGSPKPAMADAAASSSRRRATTQETFDIRLVAQRNPSVGTSQHPPQAVQAAALVLGGTVVPAGHSLDGTGVGQSREPTTAEQFAAGMEHCRFSRKCGVRILNTGRPSIRR